MNDHDFLPPGSRCCHCGMLAGPACLGPHEFPEGGGACVHCGTLSINVNQTACPGPQRPSEIRPEPARHQMAADLHRKAAAKHRLAWQSLKEKGAAGG